MLILLNGVEVIPLKAMFTCTMPYYYTRRDVIQTTSTQYFLTSLTVQVFYFVLQIAEQKCPKEKHFVEKNAGIYLIKHYTFISTCMVKCCHNAASNAMENEKKFPTIMTILFISFGHLIRNDFFLKMLIGCWLFFIFNYS